MTTSKENINIVCAIYPNSNGFGFVYMENARKLIDFGAVQSVFATLNNSSLLKKALDLGELTTIQYFTELNFYTQSLMNYLQTERDYHETIAELYKYQL